MKALHRSIWREIYQSKARFLSILLIILLGVSFYAGIKATGPNMLNTADHYYKKQHLMDTKITSPFGLTKEDLEKVAAIDEVKKVQGGYSLDLNEPDKNQVVHVMSYDLDAKQNLNQPVLTSGRLPEKSGEIVLDQRAKELKLAKIGEKLDWSEIEGHEKLNQKTYEVVGFVNSPLYIDKISRGNTSIGKGSIDYFALIPQTDFVDGDFSEAFVQYKETPKESGYSDAYDRLQSRDEKLIKKALKQSARDKYDTQDKNLAEGQKELTSGLQKLADGQKTIETETEKVDTQIKQLTQQGLSSEMLPAELKEAQNKLAQEADKIADQQHELEIKQSELEESQNLFDKLSAKDNIYTNRKDDAAYKEYQDNADRLSSIATVFPVFFFLIAALISLTTMTRMVDEKRGEIGALKALGYTNWEISQKFIVYAITASITGSLLGLVVGYHVFPTIIYNAYGSLYNLPELIITYYWSYSIQSVVVALLCTVVSALVVLRVDLLSTPATLLRPKAPKPGKRILLERIPWLWRRMNFNQKVTARNLFRYKQRMLMTVLGIAGCAAMIVTGFGIRDAIGDIVDIQFSRIWHYDATVVLNDDVTKDGGKDYRAQRDEISNVNDHLALAQKTVTVEKKGVNSQDVTLDVPEKNKNLADFVTFKDRKTGESYHLDQDGVIINEKLAKLFDVKSGDQLKIVDSNNREYQVKVSHIVENYALHFMYLTPEYYEKIFAEKPEYNVDLLKFKKELSETQEKKLAQDLMNSENVMNVTYTSVIGKQMDDTMGSLNIVVWVLIVSAALLAFIVLYNLTNINISERIRELSTIKVLGFYDREVTLYVYRENNILTILGILLGSVLGKLLHNFVLKTAEVDMMMFPPIIHPISYLYAALLTILFSLIVMWFMHQKLKHVDMIEALKSVD